MEIILKVLGNHWGKYQMAELQGKVPNGRVTRGSTQWSMESTQWSMGKYPVVHGEVPSGATGTCTGPQGRVQGHRDVYRGHLAGNSVE